MGASVASNFITALSAGLVNSEGWFFIGYLFLMGFIIAQMARENKGFK